MGVAEAEVTEDWVAETASGNLEAGVTVARAVGAAGAKASWAESCPRGTRSSDLRAVRDRRFAARRL